MNIKEIVCKIVMEVLYRGIRVLADVDGRVMKELSLRRNGEVIRIATGNKKHSPALVFEIKNGTIVKSRKKPDVDIVFKNDMAALRVFTGMMGIDRAYAAHAFTLRGSINDTMGIVRIIDIAEGYLFPGIIAGRILKGDIVREYPMLMVYLRAVFLAG